MGKKNGWGRRGGAIALTLALAACGVGPSAQDKARQHLEKGDAAAARIEASNAVQRDPNDPEAYLLLGRALAAQGDSESADRMLQKAAELGADRSTVDVIRARLLVSARAYDRILKELVPTSAHRGEGLVAVLVARGRAQMVGADTEAAKQSFDAALAAVPDAPDALVGLAQLAFVSQDVERASVLVDKVLGKHPDHAGALEMKSAMLLLQNKPEAAMAAAEKAAQRSPDNAKPQRMAAELMIGAGRYDEAQKLIDRVLKLEPKLASSHHLQALAHFRRGDYPRALEAAQTALRLDATHSPSLVLLAMTQVARGEYSQAEERLRLMVRALPNDAFLARLLGDTLLRMGNVKGAIDVLTQALAKNGSDPALLSQTADAHARAREFARASELYERAARLDPGDGNALVRLGLTRYSAGDADRGLAMLEKAAQTSDGIAADFTLALVRIERQQFKEALAIAQRIQARQPDNPIGYNVAGAALEMSGDAAGARSAFEQALTRDPAYWPAASNLARLEFAAGRPDAAKAQLEKVLARDPLNVDAMDALIRVTGDKGAFVAGLEKARRNHPAALPPRLALARAYVAAGLGDAAVQVAGEAAAIAPGRPEIIELLGSAQLAAGRNSEALATFRQLLAAAPGVPKVHLLVARTHVALGDVVAAEDAYKKALAGNPKDIEALAGLATLYERSERPAEAVVLADRLKHAHPRRAAGRVLAGDLLFRARKYAPAIEEYAAGFAIEPSGALLLRKQAARASAGQPVDEAALEQWLARHPGDDDVRFHLANRRLVAGRYAEAIRHYESLVKANPYHAGAFNNLANAYMKITDGRALAAAESAHRLRPDDPDILDTYGLLLVRAGKVQSGLEALKKALARKPDAPAIRANYAIALARSGETAAARTELRNALSGDRNLELAPEAKALLN